MTVGMKTLLIMVSLLISGCAHADYMNTVDQVDIQRFMGKWYVLAGRFTYFEQDVHNGLETYTWNAEKNRIDISFTYNKGSFDGPQKALPQKGWIENTQTNAHWKVSPLWPLKFDYLIIDLAPDYSWTAIGVPSQKYLWIMARNWQNADAVIQEAVARLNAKGYNTENLVLVPHR